MVSLVLNAENKPINIPKGWEAEMTRIHRQRYDDGLADFLIEDRLQRVVTQSRVAFSFSQRQRFVIGRMRLTRSGLPR